MKNLLLILGIVFLTGSCDLAEHWEYTVTNESSKNITYVFNGLSDAIDPTETKSYKINRGESHTTINNIEAGNYGYGMSVLLISNGTVYTFINNNPFTLSIINTLPVSVTIKADGFIDNGGSAETEIEGNQEKSVFIYTKKPNFSLVSEPRPIIFDWNFENNTVYLIIR